MGVCSTCGHRGWSALGCCLRTAAGPRSPLCPGAAPTQVASRAGVSISTGCLGGNCGICEVELTKHLSEGSGSDTIEGGAPVPVVVRACIACLPPGYPRIDIRQLDDAVWGLDGFDT